MTHSTDPDARPSGRTAADQAAGAPRSRRTRPGARWRRSALAALATAAALVAGLVPPTLAAEVPAAGAGPASAAGLASAAAPEPVSAAQDLGRSGSAAPAGAGSASALTSGARPRAVSTTGASTEAAGVAGVDASALREVPAEEATVRVDATNPGASAVVLPDGSELPVPAVVLTSDSLVLTLRLQSAPGGAGEAVGADEASGTDETGQAAAAESVVLGLRTVSGEALSSDDAPPESALSGAALPDVALPDGTVLDATAPDAPLPDAAAAAGVAIPPAGDAGQQAATWSVPVSGTPTSTTWTFPHAGTAVLEVPALDPDDPVGTAALPTDPGPGADALVEGAEGRAADPARALAANELTVRVGDPAADSAATGIDAGAAAGRSQGQSGDAGASGAVAPEPAVAAAADGLAAPFEGIGAFAVGQRRLLSAVHTDAISGYVDDGALVAATKADVDGEEGKRLDPSTIVFNIEPASLTTLPAETPSWLGTPGDTVYWAPQTWDNKDIIWPGFSTQDPALLDAVGRAGQQVRYTLADVKGPGSVEIFLNGSFGGTPVRWFSSTDANYAYHDIPTNTHAHANWVFSAAGRYELTFQLTATIEATGQVQTAQATYVFQVGDPAALQQATTTYLAATPSADGARVSLQALVTAEVPGSHGLSYSTTGTVEIFRGPKGASDPATRKGMESVAALLLSGGGATSDAIDDPGGDSVFVAVYHPKYSNEFAGLSDLADRAMPDLSRDGMTVTSVSGDAIAAGSTVRGTLDPDVQAADGDGYVVWLRDTTAMTRRLGAVSVTGGTFQVSLPQGLAASRWHKLALTDAQGDLLGWSEFAIGGSGGTTPVAPPDIVNSGGGGAHPGGGGNGGSGGGTPPGGGGGGGTGDGPASCAPAVTLDFGHMDIWNVAYADGGLVMQIKEDATGSHVLRDPATVALKVKESALADVPAGYPGGGGAAYVLPLTQDPNLIWPGWDTNGVKGSPFTDVSIHIATISGPGTVSLYTQGGFGAVTSLFTEGGYTFPATIREATPAHTHAQWTFSEKGIYTLTAYAEATNPQTGTSVRTATLPYVFQVGDVPLGDAFCGIGADTSTASTATAEEIAAAEKAQKEAEEAAAQSGALAGRKSGAGQVDGQSGAALMLGSGPGSGAVSPWAYAGIGAGSVALAGGIALGTTLLIRRRNLQLAALDGD